MLINVLNCVPFMPRSSSKPRSLAALRVKTEISWKYRYSLQNVLRSVISIHLMVVVIITEVENGRDRLLMPYAPGLEYK